MLLALDLGTSCGWALFGTSGVCRGERLASGTWHLDRDSPLERFGTFHSRLRSLVKSHKIEAIVHESVHRHAGTDAAHVFGGWLAILIMVADRARARVIGVRTQGIHAAAAVATDRRRASRDASQAERRKLAAARRKNNKSAVIEAARTRGWLVADDNEADACFLGVAALAEGACP